MIDWSQLKTSEQLLLAKNEEIKSSRKSAYIAESDHLKIEADYDAIIMGKEPDYSAWLSKVEEIKKRFPLQ